MMYASVASSLEPRSIFESKLVSDIEPYMEDISVFDDIFFAFDL